MMIDGVEYRAVPSSEWKNDPLLSRLLTKSSALDCDRCLVFFIPTRQERETLLGYVLQYRTDGDWTTWRASVNQAFYSPHPPRQMTCDAVSWYMLDDYGVSAEYRMLVPVEAKAGEGATATG